MDKNEITPINRDFLQGVSDVLAHARKNAKTAVNLSMVYAYFEIGRMIVEEEQHGANRAAYGTQLLKELSAYNTATRTTAICHILYCITSKALVTKGKYPSMASMSVPKASRNTRDTASISSEAILDTQVTMPSKIQSSIPHLL